MLKPKFSKTIAGMAMVFAISATAAISANAGTTVSWSVYKSVSAGSAYSDSSVTIRSTDGSAHAYVSNINNYGT